MATLSDTNILSSFAAAEALPYLFKLFPNEIIYIPPTVKQELEDALKHGKGYVQSVFKFIQKTEIQVLALTKKELALAQTLHPKLHDGERESIAICQSRGDLLLTNDKRALNYCQNNRIDALGLEILLRWLWTSHLLTQNEVKKLITRMVTVENLSLKPEQLAQIFAPRRAKR